tara:strand:- start:639 stop:827 length:189 start_codon:yes stop_codon:yes gene_type:complete
MSWFEKEFGEDCPVEDKSIMLREYVKRGIVEQHTDENGEFVFTLTDLGKQIFKDLNGGNKDG